MDPLEETPLVRDIGWVAGHITDPEMIAPGLREPPVRRGEREVAAIVAYLQQRSLSTYPGFDARTESASATFARHCIGCHIIDGDGVKEGPELTHIGSKRDAAYLERLITDPVAVNPKAEMPSFESRLSADEIKAIASYLAARR